MWGSFLTYYTSGSGTATQLDMHTYANSFLTLFFAAPLTNEGLDTAFYSSESAWYGFLRKSASGTLTDPPLDGAVTVPEPGTLMLLGAGLAALGLMRRRKAA